MVLWLVAGVWLITATLLSISHPQSVLPFKISIRRSAILLLQAAPLMVIFFILFPRIPGPLWGLPSDAGAAKSGLSESMSPGDISHLALSNEIAFRVRFINETPPPAQRYWRGPVFEYFDGRTWTPASPRGDDRDNSNVNIRALGNRIDYEITMEPIRQKWLYTLDLPMIVPPDAHITQTGVVKARKKIIERRLYQASSVIQYEFNPNLSTIARKRNLRLPGTINPRTRELALKWRNDGLNDAEIVQKILTIFREEDYIYSLQPPLLKQHPVDEFLFDTRKGFCEHFASSFTFLMRAAGIPSRIVTGYQGGEFNRLGGYFILRQSDAHAWSEVWLENRGWVRIDPTAAVSPLRIELNMQSAIPVSEAMAMAIARRTGEGLLYTLKMRWDWVNNSWYRWVLAYGPELQNTLMEKFGLKGWGQMILALTLLVSAFLGGLGLFLIWQIRRKPVSDPVLKVWLEFSHKMSKSGLFRLPHEGPVNYRNRLTAALPDQAGEINKIAEVYLGLRYGQPLLQIQDGKSEALESFRKLVQRFKPGSPISHL